MTAGETELRKKKRAGRGDREGRMIRRKHHKEKAAGTPPKEKGNLHTKPTTNTLIISGCPALKGLLRLRVPPNSCLVPLL